MVNVAPFNAKLVGDPDPRDTRRGRVCNMRVRQIDPGNPSMFIDCAVFREDLVECCEGLSKGDEVEVLVAKLVYDEWQAKDGGGKRSKHRLVVEHLGVIDAG